MSMATAYGCRRCSTLPPPPPIFAIGPPPNLLSIQPRCSRRLLPAVQSEKVTSSSSSSSSVSLALGIVIALLISSGTLILIKNRLVKRRQARKNNKSDHTTMATSSSTSSSSVKFNGHHHHHHHNNHHHHHQNWTKFVPLLSDSCSSEHTSSTPPSGEYPCGVGGGIVEPLLMPIDGQHEYEQIKYEDSSSTSLHYYCLVYCRQCANYHQTSQPASSSSLCQRSNLIRPCYLPLSKHSSCACQFRMHSYRSENNNNHDEHNHLFELQPMLRMKTDEENNDPLQLFDEKLSI